MNPRLHKYLPLLIFIISFSFYLSLISRGPVTLDCLELAIKSQATLKTHHFGYCYGFGYPLMMVLASVVTLAGQYVGITDNILAVNFISVVFGSLAVLALFLLVRQCCGALNGSIAALILLFNPIFLDVSTYGISHAPALCFLLLGLLSLVQFQSRQKMHLILLSALYLGLMGAARLQDLILLSPFISVVLILGLQKLSPSVALRHAFFFASTIAAVVILFHCPYFLDDYKSYCLQLKSFWQKGLTDNVGGLFSGGLTLCFSYLIKAFTPLGLLCYGAGLLCLIRLKQKPLLWTILWWVIPLGFYGNTITSVPRFLTIVLPAFIIPMSFFLAYLLRASKLLKILAIVSLLTIIGAPLTTTTGTFIRRHHYALITDFYQWVGAMTEPNALIICSDDGQFVMYYAHRKFLTKPEKIHSHLAYQELTAFKKVIDEALNSRTPVYMTEIGLSAYDDFQEFYTLMQQNYRLTWVGRKSLELWYHTPFQHELYKSGLIKVESK